MKKKTAGQEEESDEKASWTLFSVLILILSLAIMVLIFIYGGTDGFYGNTTGSKMMFFGIGFAIFFFQIANFLVA